MDGNFAWTLIFYQFQKCYWQGHECRPRDDSKQQEGLENVSTERINKEEVRVCATALRDVGI